MKTTVKLPVVGDVNLAVLATTGPAGVLIHKGIQAIRARMSAGSPPGPGETMPAIEPELPFEPSLDGRREPHLKVA